MGRLRKLFRISSARGILSHPPGAKASHALNGELISLDGSIHCQGRHHQFFSC